MDDRGERMENGQREKRRTHNKERGRRTQRNRNGSRNEKQRWRTHKIPLQALCSCPAPPQRSPPRTCGRNPCRRPTGKRGEWRTTDDARTRGARRKRKQAQRPRKAPRGSLPHPPPPPAAIRPPKTHPQPKWPLDAATKASALAILCSSLLPNPPCLRVSASVPSRHLQSRSTPAPRLRGRPGVSAAGPARRSRVGRAASFDPPGPTITSFLGTTPLLADAPLLLHEGSRNVRPIDHPAIRDGPHAEMKPCWREGSDAIGRAGRTPITSSAPRRTPPSFLSPSSSQRLRARRLASPRGACPFRPDAPVRSDRSSTPREAERGNGGDTSRSAWASSPRSRRKPHRPSWPPRLPTAGRAPRQGGGKGTTRRGVRESLDASGMRVQRAEDETRRCGNPRKSANRQPRATGPVSATATGARWAPKRQSPGAERKGGKARKGRERRRGRGTRAARWKKGSEPRRFHLGGESERGGRGGGTLFVRRVSASLDVPSSPPPPLSRRARARARRGAERIPAFGVANRSSPASRFLSIRALARFPRRSESSDRARSLRKPRPQRASRRATFRPRLATTCSASPSCRAASLGFAPRPLGRTVHERPVFLCVRAGGPVLLRAAGRPAQASRSGNGARGRTGKTRKTLLGGASGRGEDAG